jgi:hypothetical protein
MVEHKHNSRFFTKKQAFDLMGEKVVKRLDTGRIMPGTEGEVTQVSYRNPREYEVGVSWGDPDHVQPLERYDKYAFRKQIELARDREIEF